MSENAMILREISQLREAVEKTMADHENRLRGIESLHAQQKGAWWSITALMAVAGTIGGLVVQFGKWLFARGA